MSLIKWKLPPRPDHPEYRDLLAQIEQEKKRDPIKAMAWFAAVAESDFWFFQKYVMPFGELKVRDRHHKRYGKKVIDDPLFFDWMREVQDNFDQKRSDVAYMWARGFYKTTTITIGGTIWILTKNHASACDCGHCPAPDTIAIFTHKVTQVGEAISNSLVSQVKRNKTLSDHWPQFRHPRKAVDTIGVILDRKEGPKEPSVSVHPISASAASGHYTWIFVDDAVTEETARSPDECKKIDDQISFIQPLRTDDTAFVYVFTPYGDNDPMWKRVKKGGFFSRVSRKPAILSGGQPQLFSLQYFREIRRKMRDDFFESQYMLRIVPRGGAYFRKEWVRRYRSTPTKAAANCRIHILVDMAEGKLNSDYTVVRVYARTADKRWRALDLWREKMGLTDVADLLFGVMPGDEKLPGNEWKPGGGLVRFWLKVDPELDVSVEEIGSSGHAETFRREIAHRRRMDKTAPTCTIRSIRSQRKKENRIAKLQPEYRNGAFEYPPEEVGFGHGSYTTNDERDTLEQFLDDEYGVWTLAGETVNDDMLDTEAWCVQPEIFFTSPDYSEEEEVLRGIAHGRYAQESVAGGLSWREASWRVA